jgi:NAD(P)-dependent dehydrogenase (short-subunit alcohol dehydrogenase family)
MHNKITSAAEAVAIVQSGPFQTMSPSSAPPLLVNNAGITRDTAFHKMTVEQWNAVINANLGSDFA